MASSETVARDYTSYSHAELLTRVSYLEAQLRALNATHQNATSVLSPAQKKPKKAPKPFDPSRYNTRLIALKFAYLGGNYNGFEHHSNNSTPLPTIEEEMWKALRKTKLIFPQFRDGQSENEVCWDGVEYSKCGRTDKGVSAFGQVVGLRVRSARPKEKVKLAAEDTSAERPIADSEGTLNLLDSLNSAAEAEHNADLEETTLEAEDEVHWDPVKDELPYIALLNRVLPPDIRILAWCPNPPEDFSARFNCKERRYRYFFTNPAYASGPSSSEGRLDIEAMQKAAKKFEGLHDFRNFCKVDPSKQITNFERRIFHAGIHPHQPGRPCGDDHLVQEMDPDVSMPMPEPTGQPHVYYFEVRGSAFLWHQVRHLVAILFLIGQGYEQPDIVDQLLDVQRCPSKPVYDMASDAPLVLWDCMFPDPQKVRNHGYGANNVLSIVNIDDLDWIYVGDEVGGRDPSKRVINGVDDGKYGRNGIMDDLWALWRKRKVDEVLAGALMDVVACQGRQSSADAVSEDVESSARVFDGSERPRSVGKYIPVMQRARMEAPEVVNARYATRKGLNGKISAEDADE